MLDISPEAEEINLNINKYSKTVHSLLSERGKAICYQSKGILKQSAEAKGKKYNGTIGMAKDDNGEIAKLQSMTKLIYLSPKEVLPYAPCHGVPELREIWKKLIYEKNNIAKNIEISNPIVTCGLTHAISVLSFLFVDNEDEVIIPDMFWGNYKAIFQILSLGKIVSFKTFDNNEFNAKGLEEKLNSSGDKKIVLLNFPNNPTGYSPTIKDYENIVKVLNNSAESGKNILVILDDAYFGLVYEEGVAKSSLFKDLSNLHENILVGKVDGASKEEYAWGLRTGFVTYGIKGMSSELASLLENKSAGYIRATISSAPLVSQSLILKTLESPSYEKEKDELFKVLESRYKKVKDVLKNKKYEKYFMPLPYNSGYFMCVEVVEKIDTEELRNKLLNEYDTGVIAIKNLIRVAYSSLPENTIEQVFENLYEACEDLNNK